VLVAFLWYISPEGFCSVAVVVMAFDKSADFLRFALTSSLKTRLSRSRNVSLGVDKVLLTLASPSLPARLGRHVGSDSLDLVSVFGRKNVSDFLAVACNVSSFTSNDQHLTYRVFSSRISPTEAH